MKNYRIGKGLPYCLEKDTKGFERLCKILGLLNRQHRKALLDSDLAKEQTSGLRKSLSRARTKAGVKDRLLLFDLFGKPNTRLELWSDSLDETQTGEGQDHTEMITFPSLEYHILSNHIQNFNLEENTSDFNDVFVEWPDLVQHLKEDIPWANLAGHVWSNVRKDLDNWKVLNEEERRQTTLVTFAVATIVDDERILHTAILKAPELDIEFSDVLSASGNSARVEDSNEDKELLSNWNEFCEQLRKLAVEANSSPPKVDTLEEITFAVEELKKMEQSVRNYLSSCSFERLNSHVDEILNELVVEQSFSWLDDMVLNQLKTRWQEVGKSLSLEQVKLELDRLDEEVPVTSKHVQDFGTTLSEAIQLRERLREEEPSNFVLRHSWEDKITEQEEKIPRLRRELRQARVKLLSQLSPLGETFAPDSEEVETPTSTDIPEHVKESTSSQMSDINREHLTEKVEEINIADVSIATVDEADSIEQSTVTRDEHSDQSNENDTNQMESIPSPSPQGTSIAKPENGSATDIVSDIALSRVSEAMCESPPRLAYIVQVGRLVKSLDINSCLPPIELFEAILFSDHLRYRDATVALKLTEVFEQFPLLEKFTNASNRDIYVMLVLAGTIRPALLAPQSGALAYLATLKPSDRLGAVYQLIKAIKDGSQKLQGVRLDTSVLMGADSETVWDARRKQLMLDTGEWLKQAPHKTIKYAPANKVWGRWLKSDGCIYKLLSPIASGSSDDNLIGKLITKLGNRKKFEEAVKKTDRLENGRRRGEDIHAGAFNHLFTLTQEAVDIAHRYLILNSTKPSQTDFLTHTLKAYRDKFENLKPSALEELKDFIGEEKSLLAGAANSAIYAIEQFNAILTPEYGGGDQNPDPNDLIASGLFGFSSIHIDADGKPEGDQRQALDTILSVDNRGDCETAFGQYLSAGDLMTAKRIASWIEYEDLYDTEEIQKRLDEAIDRETKKLGQLMDKTRREVETALGRGSISDAERASYDAELIELEQRLTESEVLRFDLEAEKLKNIRDNIDRELNAQIEKVKVALDQLSLPPDSTEYEQLSQSIEQGDLVTANELIDRIRNNETPPVQRKASNLRQVFQEFYPHRTKEIEKELEALGGDKRVLDKLRDSNAFGGMALGNIPGEQRDSAIQMLEAWFTLKRAGRLDGQAKANITTLFSELGFIVRKVTVNRSSQNFGEADIETDPIHSRERCPIPAFGSFTKGRYRLVFRWGRPTEEDILHHADQHSVKQATIVLYFGRLSDTRRESLSRISRERSRTMLVLDELLIVFLCGERDSRMFSLFACAIPFTYVQPYVTVAGSVPPEMFYGREQEMQEIANPHGSVFIYGGRQLGKTALLRAVERMSHRPNEGSYAVFIDLKGAGIGIDREAAEIWLVIWRILRDMSVIPDEIKQPEPRIKKRLDDFIDYLCGRFSNSSGHSLLLLLDEADKFLEADAPDYEDSTKGYRESSRLKSLMDRTGRSIKVVFAGLHNVLRTVKAANHPLGHFGEPIQVGPLLLDSGLRSAEELVRQPLLVSGYRFQDENLVTRILAQTNYFPSLIQLYGSALIKAMCSKQLTGAPLYIIDNNVLDQTYKNTNLREQIRSRFNLTLQLDPRYEVIAYTIANECVEREGLLGKGIDYRRINETVRIWWPEGFEDIEQYTDGLRALLDEMVGLGVLRNINGQDDRYTLRNPNILLLMGIKDEIAENLLRSRERPQEFEREHFRARNPLKADGPSRSPLTLQQEDLLRSEQNGISLICGLPASGFGDVIPFLKVRGIEDSVIELKDLIDRREFEDKLKELHPKRSSGTTFYVVSHNVPWSENWVQTAMDQVRRLSAKGRYLQIVFMTDPQHLWSLQSDLKELNRAKFRWLPLRPWREGFLRQWMDDVGFRNDPEIRGQIIKKTGGWKFLLERLYILEQETGNLENSLKKLEKEFRGKDKASQLNYFGLDVYETHGALRCLFDVGGQNVATKEDLINFHEEYGIDQTILNRSLEWAELLHLIRRTGQDTWQMDSIAATALSSSF